MSRCRGVCWRRSIPGHRWEAGVLGAVAVVAIGDGLRTAYRESAAIGGVEAGGYVVLLGLCLAGLSLVYALRRPSPPVAAGGTQDIRSALRAIVLFSAYAVSIAFLGYFLATGLFFAAYLRVFGRYGWMTATGSAAVIAASAALLWERLGMAFPSGVVGWP